MFSNDDYTKAKKQINKQINKQSKWFEVMQRRYIMDNTQGNKMAKDASLREHFAGLAMQGILAKYGPDNQNYATTAKDAISHADALLAELDKVQQWISNGYTATVKSRLAWLR